MISNTVNYKLVTNPSWKLFPEIRSSMMLHPMHHLEYVEGHDANYIRLRNVSNMSVNPRPYSSGSNVSLASSLINISPPTFNNHVYVVRKMSSNLEVHNYIWGWN